MRHRTCLQRSTSIALLTALLAGCQVAAPPMTGTPTTIPQASSTLSQAAATQAAVASPTPASPPAAQSSPVAAATPTSSPPDHSRTLPAPAVIHVAWDDRSLFRNGLIDAEQSALDELAGASIYHLDVHSGESLRRLEGREEVRYTNQETQALGEVYFHLFPNRLGGRAMVSNLKVNGNAVEPGYELENSAMRVPLTPPLPPGQQVVIQMDFIVDVPADAQANYGAFVFKDQVLALAHFYPMIAVFDDEGWNVENAPEHGDIVYADSSFYLVRVTAPAGQTLIASGVEIDRSSAGSEQTVTYAAGPVRDFYLAASDQVRVFSQTMGETTIHSYGILGDGAMRALEHAANALCVYGDRIGAYPFTELDLVSTPNLALGIEYPGAVAITTRIYGRSAQFNGAPAPVILEATVAHEAAHQWFYSVVGNDQVDEPWLDEALAQYLTLLYYRDLYGSEAAEGLRRSFEGRWERVDREEIPIGRPVAGYDHEEYGAIVYGRGPLFFDALAEEQLGGDKFNVFLREYYRTYKWGNASTEGLKQVAERVCACDLTAMFEAWVYDR